MKPAEVEAGLFHWSSAAISCTRVDSCRSLLVFRLRDAAALDLRIPDIQRGSDADRVESIVEYQLGRAGGPCFVGSLTVAVTAEGPWLVDGQHRWLAMRRLCGLSQRFADHAVTVEAVDMTVNRHDRQSTSMLLTMQELFTLINRAVPVPEYIVNGTLDGVRRATLQQFSTLFTQRFRCFVSPSLNPRRPNVNAGALADRIAAAPELLVSMPDGTRLLDYVCWVNARLRDRDAFVRARADEKARSRGCEPLYLSADPDCAWSLDPTATHAYLTASTSQPPPPALVSPPTRGGSSRASLPAAVRRAVWNLRFGESAGEGACDCCGGRITQQAFECGHVVSRKRGGNDSVDNLRPVCGPCNRSMGTECMDAFKRTYFEKIE
jgi:hypothetical protein